MAFMNSFMTEGGFVPYEFLTDFEQDIFDFDSSDALMNFGGKQKFLFIGSFIITQMLIDRILMKPNDNGFNAEITKVAHKNWILLGALLHGIYSDLMYDTFKQIMIEKGVLKPDESNKLEIQREFIYDRYNYDPPLPTLAQIKYAYTDHGSDENSKWWEEQKVQMSKFIVLIFKLLENSV